MKSLLYIKKELPKYIVVLVSILLMDLVWRYQYSSQYLSTLEITKAFMSMMIIAFIMALSFVSIVYMITMLTRKEDYLYNAVDFILIALFLAVLVNLFFSWLINIIPLPPKIVHLFAGAVLMIAFTCYFVSSRIRNYLQIFILQKNSPLYALYHLLFVISVVFLAGSFIFNFFGQRKIDSVASPRLLHDRVILITLDSVGANMLSSYGKRTDVDKNIAAFASESYVFKNMIANGPNTIFGMPSILRSNYPVLIFKHKLKYKKQYDQGFKGATLASVLKEQGFKNHFLCSMQTWNRYLKAIGFHEGFEKLPDVNMSGNSMSLWLLIDDQLHRAGLMTWFGKITEKYFYSQVRWLVDTANNRKIAESLTPIFDEVVEKCVNYQQQDVPSFHWVHIFDFHEADVLSVPDFYQGKVVGVQGRKEQMLQYIDHEIGVFIDTLKSRGIYDRSIIIITADHGFGKDYTADDRIKVPLIIHMPKQTVGKVLYTNAEHVDIAPTIFEMVGADIPKDMQGESLVRYINGTLSNKTKIFFQTSLDPAGNKDIKGTIITYKNDHKCAFKYDYNDQKLSLLSNSSLLSKIMENDVRRTMTGGVNK